MKPPNLRAMGEPRGLIVLAIRLGGSVRRLQFGRMHHQPNDASKQADHKDRRQQRVYDPEHNAPQSAQLLGHRLMHEVTTPPWQVFISTGGNQRTT